MKRLLNEKVIGLPLVAALALFAGCKKHGAESEAQSDEPVHGTHAGEAGEQLVRLTDAEMKEFDVQLATAGPGKLRPELALPGEVVFNPDRVAHVLPRVPGVAREVRKMVGDAVKRGDVLAILESRELASAKAEYLASVAMEELATATYQREDRLWKQRVSSEQAYLEAKQGLEEARIKHKRAERALHALGLPEEGVARLPLAPETEFTRYELTSPLDGTVVERHLVQGELTREDAKEPHFVVADLSNVWIQLTVYQKDLSFVRKGQRVRVTFGPGIAAVFGQIDYVSASLSESTRTATARIILDNATGAVRPGLFVTGYVELADEPAEVVLSKAALLVMEDQTVVFVQTPKGFKPVPVQTGRSDQAQIEITAGLTAGQRYVAKNALTLKAELGKGALGEEH